MARELSSLGSLGANSRLYNASACDFQNADFSIALWLYPNSVSTLLFKGRYGTAGWYAQIGRSTSLGLDFVSYNGSTVDETYSTASFISTGQWQHIGITRSGSSVKFFRDGVEASYGASGSHGVITSSSDEFVVGAYWIRADLSTTGHYAEIATYDSALSSAQIASLARGFSPMLVSAATLRNYWPLIGRATTEPDLTGAGPLSNLDLTQSSHPRVIYPRRKQVVVASAGAPAGDAVPQVWSQYRRRHAG